ncbi:synaptic vesicle membrane protein VAT-1 homolog isoform X2 [Ixodes scapularis]|uniref:synaptic vesicle membrane protein VAT-1 homolog isoform X2 n=1 Tax=Ixodes scapularis TaxID=6945 RepID=UPI001A9D4FFF|nr:synaptic vesicle membrane protein VAT-1 homolog isoform X2 [Ixodes scapularis]
MELPTEGATAYQVVLTGFGGFDKLAVSERAVAAHDDELGDSDVRVRVRACGMNFADNYVRQGIYVTGNLRPPLVMGMEAAGDVVQVGSDVRRIKVGDRVMCWSFRYGLWTSLACVPEARCLRLPEQMSYAEGAAFPINYATAYLAILDFGGLKKGQKVLVQAAAGGVGWAATQLCHTVEDVTVFGTSSASKFTLTRRNGVNHPINYREEDFVQKVLQIEPKGVDIVLDSLSGADFTRSRQLLKPMGRLIHIGISNMVVGERFSVWNSLRTWWQTRLVNVYDLNTDCHAVCGFNLALLADVDPDRVLQVLQHLLELYGQGKVKPRIDSQWSFGEVARAMEHMITRKNVGKIILIPGGARGKAEETTS